MWSFHSNLFINGFQKALNKITTEICYWLNSKQQEDKPPPAAGMIPLLLMPPAKINQGVLGMKYISSLLKVTSRMVHLEIIGHFFQVHHSLSVLIFSILNLSILILHPQPSLFLFGLLSPLWCFSTLVNYYFEAFFNLKVILHFAKMT